MKQQGFTLAEVLITLLIIGVVAALTIPSVISNYQQQEFKTGLKKAVSVLNEAIQTNIAQEGETPYENENLYEYLQRHISILKSGQAFICSSVYQEGVVCSGGGSNNYFYTTDGMRFEVGTTPQKINLRLHEANIRPIRESRCGSYGLLNNPNNTNNPPCVIMVDVNGDKKPSSLDVVPNRSGITVIGGTTIPTPPDGVKTGYIVPSPSDKKVSDVFNILITEEKAIPFGVVAQRAMYSK